MSVLKDNHKISRDWKGKRYLGLDLDWDYDQRKIHLLMMPYVTDTFTRSQHANHWNPQHQPYLQINPTYGTKAQYAEASDVSPPLGKSDKNLYRKSQGLLCIMHRQSILLC